ncbi:Cof-type HAD-IIB family hydrolase [Gottfriedia acidiceleris]|uniref:Cof-type HAD-IIB family hydrolase n=1 Tax=Gottfriedia acidiceleris TaxID=371036 RepID=UPI000B4506C4|nr:Cof-type HAD-IIB family hydrolase [Gottfriedia acidiceleris]
MKTKHLIALDLDGTLLTDEKTISERTLKVIYELKNQGHEVCISTGRPFRASKMYYDQLKLTTPIVNFNGAYVHHPLDDSWGVYHESLPLEVAKEVISSCREYELKNMYAEIMDDVYADKHQEEIIPLFHYLKEDIIHGDLVKNLTQAPTCLLIDSEESHVASIREHLSNVHAEVIDHRRWAAPHHIIEIVKAGMNKAIGLQKVASFYNIPRKNIIAFGDEDNDLEMIEYAGHGVAMENAIHQLKNIANHTTLSNQEDGIAIFLEDFFNLKL